MNIFVLDRDPNKAAMYHNDKHCVKMILESVQMLMTSYYKLPDNHPIFKDKDLYKLTHKNHPCTLWVNESFENWCWLRELAFALNNEWMKRYNHDKSHLSIEKLIGLTLKYGTPPLESKGLTEFAQAMPDQYKDKDVVKAYRNYYLGDKRDLASWKTEIPYWWN